VLFIPCIQDPAAVSFPIPIEFELKYAEKLQKIVMLLMCGFTFLGFAKAAEGPGDQKPRYGSPTN